jgi:hypothetical protein
MFSLLNYDFLQGYSHIDFNIAPLDLTKKHVPISLYNLSVQVMLLPIETHQQLYLTFQIVVAKKKNDILRIGNCHFNNVQLDFEQNNPLA